MGWRCKDGGMGEGDGGHVDGVEEDGGRDMAGVRRDGGRDGDANGVGRGRRKVVMKGDGEVMRLRRGRWVVPVIFAGTPEPRCPL